MVDTDTPKAPDNTAIVVGAIMDTLGLTELKLSKDVLIGVSGSISIEYDLSSYAYIIRKWPEEQQDEEPLSDG